MNGEAHGENGDGKRRVERLHVSSVVYPTRSPHDWNRKSHSSPSKSYRRTSGNEPKETKQVGSVRDHWVSIGNVDIVLMKCSYQIDDERSPKRPAIIIGTKSERTSGSDTKSIRRVMS